MTPSNSHDSLVVVTAEGGDLVDQEASGYYMAGLSYGYR